MRIQYNLIYNGVVIDTQFKDFDGDIEMNNYRIIDDVYGSKKNPYMDPLFLARNNKKVTWIEAKEIKEN